MTAPGVGRADSEELSQRLSRISTQWSRVFEAHGDGATTVTSAQQELLLRYRGAVYRYLLGSVRDPDAADDLAQEFALRFLRGDFHAADPQRGRFRDYLKTALRHLVHDHYRARHAWPRQLASDSPEPAAPDDGATERDFLADWREELLERTWEALAAAHAAYHAVLLCRVENPELPSAQAAEQLGARLGKPVTADWVRKTAQRAQEKFADLLLDEVARSLENSAREKLQEELGALDLLKYCRSALERRARTE